MHVEAYVVLDDVGHYAKDCGILACTLEPSRKFDRCKDRNTKRRIQLLDHAFLWGSQAGHRAESWPEVDKINRRPVYQVGLHSYLERTISTNSI